MSERKKTKTAEVKTEKKPRGITPNSIGPQLNFAAHEAFKRLRTNVLIALPKDEDGGKVVGITSAQPSEGKSTVSANLAYVMAEQGLKVLLVDGDVRLPTLHEKLHFDQTPGLSDLLTDSFEVKSVMNTYAPEGSKAQLDVLTSGTIADNAAELLGSRRMRDLLKALKTHYDYVVLDLPPVSAVVDAIEISREADGMIVVLRDNHCPRQVLKDCMDQLNFAQANVLGFVMNGVGEGGTKYKYSGDYGYGYGYGYNKKYGYGYGYGYRNKETPHK